MRIFGWHGLLSSSSWGGRSRRDRASRRALRPRGEPLEGRALLAVAGTDYVVSGFRWADPSRITYSIAPDGVAWDHGTNNLNATFNARFGAAWTREVARALATWQSVANINIARVGDGNYKLDAMGQAQGDPRFGDIRFGGYGFSNTTTTLAQTYFPPPDGWTAAGDVEVNTAMNYNVGADYDFYSVMLHETGHALGLEHPPEPSQVMYARYGGVRSGLQPGDLAGIQAIYGARQPDAFRAGGQGASLSRPIDVAPRLDANGAAVVAGLSLSTIGDTSYFRVVAPAGATGGLRVSACANGFSLLSPRVSVLDAAGRTVATQADPASWSNNVTTAVQGVVPGQVYYVAVSGATSDVFAIGAYALLVQFDATARLPVGPTPAPTPDPDPAMPLDADGVAADRFEPNDQANRAVRLGQTNQVTVAGLTLDSATDVDTFAFRNGRAGVVVVTARGAHLRLVDGSGRVLAEGDGQVGAAVARPRTQLYVQIRSDDGLPLAGYTLGLTCSPTVARGRLRAVPAAQAAADTPQALPAASPIPAPPSLAGWWNARPRTAARRG